MSDLAAIAAEAATCRRCALAEGRTRVVFGMGNPDADLLFVGEGPGAEEDAAGLPFVGRSGKLLDRMMFEEIGLTRADCYIANTVKCLRYDTEIQLGDGHWERVDRLVRSRYDGFVMSVDANDRLVSRRVVGWHSSPLAGRRVFRLTCRSAKRAGTGKVGLELTGDHPVLTEQGYVAVEALSRRCRIATGEMRVPFNPERVTVGVAQLLYDEVELRETTSTYTSDTTFYCLDVEETHNFVTAGGVVHNCRPPANRDPRPEEMKTCRAWLDAQLIHIKPLVVVTLGNVATRSLLGRKEGITQLRGRAYPWEGRTVIPTYHPSAALRGIVGAAAGIRADLVRAKQALAATTAAHAEPGP